MQPGTYPKMWKAKKEEVGTEDISVQLLKRSIMDSLEAKENEEKEDFEG